MPSALPSTTSSWIWRLTATAPIGTAALVRPLAKQMMSGVTPQCLRCGRAADSAEAADDLVENQDDAVFGANVAQPLQIADRRHQYAG